MEKPKKIDAIVFDCDGVLIDSEALLERVDLAFLEKLGIPFTKDEYHEHFTGSTYAQNIKVIQDRHMEVHGQPVSESVADDLSRERTEVLEKELTAIQGASEMLGILTLKKAVASNTTQNSWLRKKVTQVGLDHHFGDHIYAAENVENGKPAPDLYLFAANQLGVPPENCVAIEDSPRGVQAAVAAGMYTVGFSGSSHLDHATHEKKLLDAGAQQVFADMTEFQNFIEGLAG
tara:strand:+ start:5071 stop:5766 length:696 start_codon:yes stop_codon:yes gene_type:complete